MNFYVGFQTFEFRLALERPGKTEPVPVADDREPVVFVSNEDALKWLKQLGFLHTNLLVQLRAYVARHFEEPETYRHTNHYALERLAKLLYLRRIVVTCIHHPASAGSPTPVPVPPAPAFPLSERSQRDSSTSYQPPADTESATFGSDIDPNAQAGALVAAAAEGKPFCPE